MLETVDKEEDKHLLEAEFYNTPFFFSYSSLNRLMLSPSIFYKEYVLKEKEVKTERHLLEGTLTHFLLLEGNNFDDNFIITPEALPSDNSKKVANEIHRIYEAQVKEDPSKADLELGDFEPEILEVLAEMNLHQSVGEAKRAGKIIEPKTIAYFNYLKVKDTKEIIDSTMLDKASLGVEKIKANADIMTLLGMDKEVDGETFAVYNEIALKMDMPDLPFGLKGIIDNMTIDVPTKTININDFKTSGKALSDFPDTVEYWKYWLQAVIYIKLAKEFFKAVINNDPEWKINFRFVVFDKYDHLYAYPVTSDTLKEWEKQAELVLNAAKYHYDSKDFTLPYEFAVGNVKL
jgi:hypothetical protein